MSLEMNSISIVILTYNRIDMLRNSLFSLQKIRYKPLEIIVVDNNSRKPVSGVIKKEFSFVTMVVLPKNIGVGGRNAGIKKASGDIIITLDDDIVGIDDLAINKLITLFKNSMVGAVCFKVVHPVNNEVVNWCHHYPVDTFSERSFVTNEITEGAVAFRKETLKRSGLYPESFFISHEGPDIAFRIMNQGYSVMYYPEIVVKHFHSKIGRESWRRYYYDTRNLLWLVVRNYTFWGGLKHLFIGLSSMLVYSVRDGYIIHYMRGIFDGLLGIKREIKNRTKPTKRTLEIMRTIEKNRPNFIEMVKKRVFQKEIRI